MQLQIPRIIVTLALLLVAAIVFGLAMACHRKALLRKQPYWATDFLLSAVGNGLILALLLVLAWMELNGK